MSFDEVNELRCFKEESGNCFHEIEEYMKINNKNCLSNISAGFLSFCKFSFPQFKLFSFLGQLFLYRQTTLLQKLNAFSSYVPWQCDILMLDKYFFSYHIFETNLVAC